MRRLALFLVVLTVIVFAGVWQKTQAGSGIPASQNSNWDIAECDEEAGNSHPDWGHSEHVCQKRTSVIRLSGEQLGASSQNGRIEVIGEDRNDVRIEATIHAWAGNQSDAQKILNQVQIETSGDEIRDRGPRFHIGNKGYGIHYKIHVPQKLSVDLKSTNGGIAITHLDGRLRFNTTNGGISLSDVAGDARGETTNGGVSVALNGDRWQGSGLHVETTNGGISMTLPEQYSAHLEAGTTNGGIHIDFPIKVAGAIKNQLNTDIGSGGPTIHAVTTNGGISISHDSGNSGGTL